MIIAICGLQGSGKDTIGNYLVEKYGFNKLSFAMVLKDILSLLFLWDRNLLEGNTEESRKWRETVDEWWSQRLKIPNFTPRYALRYFGTELFRDHFHPDIWTATIEKRLKNYKNIVITDCRFPNEIQMLKDNGALLLKITREKLPLWYKQYENNQIEKPEGIHPSEYSWIKSKFNYEFTNNGEIQELYKYIDNLLEIENFLDLTSNYMMEKKIENIL
jgi:hypothetical protein